MPPVIVVFPDCFTAFGTQYIRSSAIGNYADYLNLELVPFVDDNFRTKAESAPRFFGKSSGGYGALTLAMGYPKIWGGIASLVAIPTSTSSTAVIGLQY